MGRIWYFMKEAFRGFFEAKLMTFASIGTISFTFFIMGALFVGFFSIRTWLQYVTDTVDVVAYISEETAVDPQRMEELAATVNALAFVSTAKVVDKAQAWQRFESLYGSDMLDAVDDNPLPASLEISLDDKMIARNGVESMRQTIVGIEGIEGINYSREWFGFLAMARNAFAVASIVCALMLVAALYFMISNTIKLTIYARRELVVNMRYVGATDWYIKMPFLLEGMMQGIIGAAVALAALAALRICIASIPLVWGAWQWYLLVFPAGAFLGWIGSSSAVSRFLE